MAKPKLALVPSTIGTKVYSVLPSNGDGDFTFTRATKATRINSQGLIEEVLSTRNRLNYSLLDGEVQECPHLLLEPARTNLISYSEDFSQSYWTKNGTSVTGSFVSPDGTSNATKLVENSSNSEHRIFNGSGLSVSGNVSMSVFAKKGGRDFIRLTNNVLAGAFFDLNNGVVLGVSSGITAKIEDFGNDWYRCSITQTGVANERLIIYLSNNGVDTSYTGDGTSGVYIYGAQLEAGSYPTSYIKTTGSAVTRNAEVANGAGSASTFNNTKGVLMTEMASLVNTNSAYNSFSIGAGSTNVMSVGFTNALDTLYVYKTNGSSAWLGQVPIVDIAKFNKVSFRYNGSNNEFWVNGFKLATNNTIGVHASAMSDMDFNAAFGGEPMYSKTKQVQYFDSELTESQLEELTSWVSFREMAEGQGYIIE